MFLHIASNIVLLAGTFVCVSVITCGFVNKFHCITLRDALMFDLSFTLIVASRLTW